MRLFNQHSLLLIIIICSIIIRLFPLKYGLSLAEVDPYHHYWLTEKLLNGEPILGASDKTSWYPRERILSDVPPGVSFIGAGFYKIFSPLGFDLKTVCVFIPIPFVIFTLMLIYFLGREISSKLTGLIAAILFSMSPIYAMGSTVGWFDNDVIGLMFLLAAGLFFIKANKTHKLIKSLVYASITGIFVFCVCITWLGYYVIGLISLVYLLWIVIKRKTTFQSLAIFVISLLPAMYLVSIFWANFNQIPIMLFSLPVLPFYFVLFMALMTAFYGSSIRILMYSFAISLTIIIGLFTIFSNIPYDPRIALLFNPLLREDMASLPFVTENVATRPKTLWQYHGVYLAYCAIGIAGLFMQRKFNVARLFLIVYFITAFYFAVIMIRLNFLASAVISLLSAFGIEFMIESMKANILHLKTRLSNNLKRNVRIEKHFRIIIMVCIMLTLLPRAYSSIIVSDRPNLIDTAFLFDEPNSAWNDALEWTRDNCKGEVVIAWWDFGHWLKAEGKVITVCDNTLVYPDQVAKVGLLYLSDEETAWDMMKNEFGDAEYALVFTTFTVTENGIRPLWFGDDGKWHEMHRLTKKFYPALPDLKSFDKDGDELPDTHCLLGKAMFYSMGYENIKFDLFKVKYITPIEEFKLHEDYARIVILQKNTKNIEVENTEGLPHCTSPALQSIEYPLVNELK